MNRPPLALVVAVGSRRVIGMDGDLPWRFREDLRHFKRVTVGHAIIMGRKTYDSIGKPLPERHNIVVTRNRALSLPGTTIVHSLGEAIAQARAGGDDEPRVIGGATLYEEAFPLATRLYLTEVDLDVPGDTFFPEFDRGEWTEISRREGRTEGLTFLELTR